MERIKTPPGLLFASFLYRTDLHSQNELLSRWTLGIGDILIPEKNPLFEYYAREMGLPLSRFFILSSQLVPREDLLRVKLLALEWEKEFSLAQKRMVNVDIGLLSAENFILATTKNYSHRIFLGQDIFADLTFEFRKGKYEIFPWTYPDYTDEEKLRFFTRGRERLLTLLRG